MHTSLHQPIEGAFFRMAFRHFLTIRGYSRDQAKALVSSIAWDAFKARICEKGPSLLDVFKSYDFTERPAFPIDSVPDDSDFDINVPNWTTICEEGRK